MKALARTLILLVRFLSEIGALLGFAVWGFSESGWFGILPPIAAAAVWGRYMAPKSQKRLDDPVRLIAELIFFGLATSAFAAADARVIAPIYGAIAMICAVVVRYTGEPELREPGARPAA